MIKKNPAICIISWLVSVVFHSLTMNGTTLELMNEHNERFPHRPSVKNHLADLESVRQARHEKFASIQSAQRKLRTRQRYREPVNALITEYFPILDGSVRRHMQALRDQLSELENRFGQI